MNELAKKSQTRYEILLIGILILTILPFLILHLFNHPTPEDFYFEEGAKDMGLFNAIKVYYKFWGGRYFTYFVTCLNPLYFNSIGGFKIYGMILMMLFYFALHLFVSEFTKESLNFRERILFSLSVFFLYIYSMPSANQGFYWILSCIHYNIGLILIMLFLVYFHRMGIQISTLNKNLYLFVTCLIAMAIPGTVELSAAVVSVIMLVLLIKNLLIDRKFEWWLALIAALTFICVYIVFKSPGNSQRSANYTEDHQLYYSLYTSFTFLFESVISWIFVSPLLIFTVLFIPTYFKISKSSFFTKNVFSYKLYYPFLICSALLYLSTFLIIWSLGMLPYDRILNYIYFIFLIGWFWNMIVLTYSIAKKYKIESFKFPAYSYLAAIVLLILFLIRDNNIKTAYAELLDGTAAQYDKAMYERYDFIIENKSDSVTIDSIRNIPESFFLQDVTANPEKPFNKGYQSYFKKKYILRKN